MASEVALVAYLSYALLAAAYFAVELFVFPLLGDLVAFAAEALHGDEVWHSSRFLFALGG